MSEAIVPKLIVDARNLSKVAADSETKDGEGSTTRLREPGFQCLTTLSVEPNSIIGKEAMISSRPLHPPSLEFQARSRSLQEVADEEHSDRDDSSSEAPLQRGNSEAQPLLSSDAFHVRFASKAFLSPWFPQVDPSNPRAKTWRTWHSRREVLLTTCCAISGTVLLLNITATIAFKVRWKAAGDLGRIYEGDCTTSQRLSTGLHFLINALSTLLFSSSNLCMQLLVAPTRKEVDKAHRQRRWLDIGVPSVRNLFNIATERQIVWIILGLSSVPLHFLFNSAIISTLGTNNYAHITVDPTFLNGSSWNSSATLDSVTAMITENLPGNGNLTWQMLDMWSASPMDLDRWIYHMQQNAKNTTMFTKEEPLTCLLQYADLFGNRSDVMFVTSTLSTTNNSLFAYGISGSEDPWKTGWYLGLGNEENFDSSKLDLSNFPGGAAERLEKIANWSIAGQKIDYCLSSQISTEDLCSVEYSQSIMILVCVFNFIKFSCILYTTFRYSRHKDPPLSILGDALCSFLQNPDETTRNLGILSHEMIRSNVNCWRNPQPQKWEIRPSRWIFAASWRRWTLCLILSFALIIGAAVEFRNGLHFFGTSFGSVPSMRDILSMGFGAVNPRSISNLIPAGPTVANIYKNVLFDNSWQFFISCTYVLYNSLVSTFLVSDELVGYAKTRKTLRVSAPEGIQRSSYFVSMPARYGIPLMVTMGLLHWTVSQSIFVICIDRYYSNGAGDPSQRYITSGFSCVAILTSIIIGIVLLIALLALGARRYSGEMPLASTCSAAISALCHPPEEDVEVALFPVMWGEVSYDEKCVGHCSFTTAADVREPIVGQIYT